MWFRKGWGEAFLPRDQKTALNTLMQFNLGYQFFLFQSANLPGLDDLLALAKFLENPEARDFYRKLANINAPDQSAPDENDQFIDNIPIDDEN